MTVLKLGYYRWKPFLSTYDGLDPVITLMKETLTSGLAPIIAFTKVDLVTINK